MTRIIGHLFINRDEPVLLNVVVKFSARERVPQRDLDGLYIQFFRKIYALADGLSCFARQADDEVAVNGEAQLLAVSSEAASHVDGGALLDVFQDLLIA